MKNDKRRNVQPDQIANERIEWVMERYQVTTHLERGSTNNLNDWAAAVGNPRYILDLLWSVINVGVQTVCGSPPDKPESDSNIQRRMLKT